MKEVALSIGRARIPSGLVALVDDEDYATVTRHQWRLHVTRQGLFAITGKTLLMHRLVMDAGDQIEVGHINKDGLDNRKSNLRLATHSQHVASRWARVSRSKTSSFRGVSFSGHEGRTRPWRATISVEGHKQSLGYHLTEEEAALAYDEGARRFFGRFARTNFMIEGGA